MNMNAAFHNSLKAIALKAVNCLTLASNSRRYSRVDCTAACPDTYEVHKKHLLEIGDGG